MLDFQAQQTSEAQLAALLGELLEGEEGGGGNLAAGDVPAEIAEMRDMARLLRAASQSIPLPEGRVAVRRALLATVPSHMGGISVRAAWRRTGRWLSVAATAALVIAAFGLGAGLLDSIGSPSSPLYGVRMAIDRARLALVPGGMRRTGSTAESAQARTVEMNELAASGFAPAAVTGYPLTYSFAGVTIPSAPGQEVTVQGTIGGLPGTLSLTAAGGCQTGTTCGLFEAWITPLRGTLASAEFGQMRGTFVCTAGQCKLTLVNKTGVFNKITASVLPVNAAAKATGLVGTAYASLGDWVSTVEQTAATLTSEGLLPVGVTVNDLVRDAATNQSVPKSSPQGKSPGTTTSGNLGGPGVGVATGGTGPSVVVGAGTGSGTHPGGESSGGIAVSTNSSTSVSGSGVSGSASGTASGSAGTSGGSRNASTSSTDTTGTGAGSTSTSTSGTANTSTSTSTDSASGSGSVSVTTSTASGSTSGSGSVSGGTSSGGVSVAGGVSVGGGSVGGGSVGGGGVGGGGGAGGGGLGGHLP